MKVNNTAEKSILNAEKLSKALSEGTEKTLKSIFKEALSEAITDDDEKDEEEPTEEPAAEEVADDKDYNVEDVDDEVVDDADDDSVEDADGDKAPEDSDDADDDAADKDWSEFEDFKTDDNDYDFTTGEKEDVAQQLLKVFSVMGDDDQLIVTKDNDKLTITNEDDDTEEVVDLEGGDAESDDDEIEIVSDEEDENPSDDEFEFDLDSDSEDDADDDSVEDVDTDDEPEEKENEFEFDIPDDEEGEDDDKDLHEEEEFVDDELEEGTNVGGAVQLRSASKSHIPAGRKAYVPRGSRNVSAGAEYSAVVEGIKAENANLKKENKQIKEGLESLKKSLTEAAVLNINLGQVVKLLVNETTTKDEKKAILNRFSNVKTIKEGKELYETITSELKESIKKKNDVVLERKISADNSKSSLTETTFYQENVKNNPSIELMRRMDNLYKK